MPFMITNVNYVCFQYLRDICRVLLILVETTYDCSLRSYLVPQNDLKILRKCVNYNKKLCFGEMIIS